MSEFAERMDSIKRVTDSAVTFGMEIQKYAQRMTREVEAKLVRYRIKNGEWTWLFPYEIERYEKHQSLPRGWRNRK